MRISLEEIARIIGAPARAWKNLPEFATGYSIDSRSIRAGDLFFAVRGGSRDGHEFVEAALAAGAVGAVVSRGLLRNSERLLLAPDPRAALQTLASQVRTRWGGRVVGITGSNGKTTTKEVTACLLAARFRVAKSEGNLNNDLGLPLSVLRMPDDAEIGVMEMGMNHPGEIRCLAGIARPEIGVVTNVTPAHLEFFSSIDEIALAKRELIESLPPDGTAILNADDERVRAFAGAYGGRVVTFGIESEADVRAVDVEELGLAGTRFRLATEGVPFSLPLPGRHNLYNVLAGLAVSSALGIAPSSLQDAVAALRPARMRGEVVELGEVRIINDCYNSNPRAAEMMLELLAATPARRRVAVLGEMLELGGESERLHREVGNKAARLKLDLLAGVRGDARYIIEEARRERIPDEATRFFEDPREAGEFLKSVLLPGDTVLLKASRGVKLEQALEALKGARPT